MGIECSECEHDLRGGHADDCSRAPRYLVMGYGESDKPDMVIVHGDGNVRHAVARMIFSDPTDLSSDEWSQVDACLDGFDDEDMLGWSLGGTRFDIKFEIGGIEITRLPQHNAGLSGGPDKP